MELLIFVLILLLSIATYNYMSLRKQMRELSRYIDAAMEGNLVLDAFDEKELSKIKSKLFKFLYANQIRESKLAIEKNKTKSLIADISHQTKTPLTNLSLYTSFLESDPNEEYLEVIKYELNKLQFLIDTLVKSSRLESDIIVLQKTKANLADLVGEVLREFRGPLANKNIHLSYTYEDCIFDLDERWLDEAIHNLLDNAIKYSPDHTTITISVYKSPLNYNLDIENECQNLSEEDLANIFKRFYRGVNSVSKDGLGLGLYIAREIIEKHGGNLKASLNDNSIKFSIDFPL